MRLAVFDLDGTITRRDTLLPYVIGFVMRRPWRFAGFAAALPTLVRFALGFADRGQLKAALMHWTLGGCTRAELEGWTEGFVARLLARGAFRDAITQIGSHRDAADHLVLMSASPDLYVPAIARRLGFAESICTGVAWRADRLDGRLTTPNRRGEEKVRCFEELRRRHASLATVAYGNAASDLPHLKLADRGVLVNGARGARELAKRDGVICVDWN